MCQRPQGFPLKFFLSENLVKPWQDFKCLIWTPSEQNILIFSIQIKSQIFLFFSFVRFILSIILYILKVQSKIKLSSIFRCLGLILVVLFFFSPLQILLLEEISQFLNYVSIETKQKSEVSQSASNLFHISPWKVNLSKASKVKLHLNISVAVSTTTVALHMKAN